MWSFKRGRRAAFAASTILGVAVVLVAGVAVADPGSDGICQTFEGPGIISDTYIRSAAPDRNYASDRVLVVNDAAVDPSVALLRFELSRLSPGADVRSATLSLHKPDGGDETYPRAFAAAAPWSEFSVTWNAYVSPESPLDKGDQLSCSLAPGDAATLECDVTAMAASWINRARPNFGLVLQSDYVRFDSSRSDRSPALTICYVPGQPSCDDGVQNGDETGVDCGDSCGRSCRDFDDDFAPTQPACTIGGVSVDPSSPACQTQVQEATPFAIFATGTIMLGDFTSVAGDVMALGGPPCDCVPPPALTLGIDVSVDPTSLVTAPRVALGPGSTVGHLYATSLSGDGSYASRSPYEEPVAPVPIAPIAASGEAVEIGDQGVLAAGSYASVTVGRGATLTLTGGEYVFGSFTMDTNAQVLVDAVSRIVTGHVHVGARARILPTPASRATVNLTLVSTAVDAPETPAIEIGSNATIAAFISAANGTVLTADGLTLSGSIFADKVDMGPGGSVTGKGKPVKPCFMSLVATTGTSTVPVNVDDGNPCTWDYCDPTGGQPCDTGSDCPSGVCIPPLPFILGAKGVCQVPGVQHVPMPEGAACNDEPGGDPCSDFTGVCDKYGACIPFLDLPSLNPVPTPQVMPFGSSDNIVAAGRRFVYTGTSGQVAFVDRQGSADVIAHSTGPVFATLPCTDGFNCQSGMCKDCPPDMPGDTCKQDNHKACGCNTDADCGGGVCDPCPNGGPPEHCGPRLCMARTVGSSFLDRVFDPDTTCTFKHHPCGLNINAHQGFSASDALTCPAALGGAGAPYPFANQCGKFEGGPCPHNQGASDKNPVEWCAFQDDCINEAYEGRVQYDCRRSRFVYQGHVRNKLWRSSHGDVPAPWQPNTKYSFNQTVLSFGNLYVCTTPGTSGSIAPMGTLDVWAEPNNTTGLAWAWYGTPFDDVCNANPSSPEVLKLARRQQVFAISNAEDPRSGFKYYWYPYAYSDMPHMGLNGAYLSGTWENHSGANISAFPSVPFDDPPALILTRLDDLMNGDVPEGPIPANRVFAYALKQIGQLGAVLDARDGCNQNAGVGGCASNCCVPEGGDYCLPANESTDSGICAGVKAALSPVVQHGVVRASDNRPERDAAFFIMQGHTGLVESGGNNYDWDPGVLPLVGLPGPEQTYALRLVFCIPPPDDPRGRPVCALRVFPIFRNGFICNVGRIRTAVIHDSFLHFLGEGSVGGPVYGRVPISTRHIAQQGDRLEVDVGTFEFFNGDLIDQGMGNSSTINALNPTFDVTAGGTPMITYGRATQLGPSLRALNIGNVALSPDLTTKVASGDRYTGGFFGSPATQPVKIGGLDYASSARDPLFPTQVWFAHSASWLSSANQLNKKFVIGANQYPPQQDP